MCLLYCVFRSHSFLHTLVTLSFPAPFPQNKAKFKRRKGKGKKGKVINLLMEAAV